MTSNIPPLDPNAADCPGKTPAEAQAEHHAFLIQIANQWLFQMDEAYLIQCAKDIRAKADRYDAAAVLNRQWNEKHAKVLQEESAALEYLAKYICANKNVTRLRAEEKQQQDTFNKLSSLFY